ncbi:minor tail protein [Xanthomonas phage Langgrundblatt2]|uniref:Minor tail protein n=2 Tax=Shirevirus TaxID=3153128 RepID=A0A9E7E322_9CAUD|nr:minor tail protein [Xanthomonas phage Langgrundblatt1]YP_010742919.1 minor tail protein [Xanthomonas phage Langgrundblatt2]URA06801.1 minor tail protein [Xanthomonas phage Langgrundblatt1]URA06870.1 minor tail protein [Xanthomonas phage Langgrundblatt2]
MTAELDVAVKEMEALFNAAWQANAAPFFGYVPAIEWFGKETKDKVDRTKVWARFSTQNVFEEQATLSACVDEPFVRRWNGSGLIFVQLFLPKTVANAVIQGRKLAKVARNAYRGKKTDGGVTFYNVRINDNIPPEEMFYRINVVAEYDYDELG